MEEKKNNNENIKKLYDMLEPITEKVYLEYSYAKIDKTEYKRIVKATVMAISKDIDRLDMKKFNVFFEGRLKEYINKYIKTNKSVFKQVFNNYLEFIDTECLTYNDALKQLKMISEFFSKIGYVIEPDVCMELLNKNNRLQNILKIIVDNKKEVLKKKKIEDIYDNDTFVILIRMYCMINNVELFDGTDNLERNNNNTDDSTRGVNTLDLYLKEIKMPLLTKEEELELYNRVKNGDEEAKNIFVESNLRLVVNIAKTYIGRGLSFQDLIQEGNLGLIKAVERYDGSKDYRFSTYAYFWIVQALTRAIANYGRKIRIPVNLHNKVVQYKKASQDFTAAYGRNPTIKEMALELGISTLESEKLYNLQNDAVSLNVPIGDDHDDELETLIPADEVSFDSDIELSDMQRETIELINNSNLTEKEKTVLMLRFGIAGNKKMTLEEIGDMYGVTKERIRQIENKAIMKLGRNKQIEKMAIYMDNPDKAIRNLRDRNDDIIRGYGMNNTRLEERKKVPGNGNIKTIYELLSPHSREDIDNVILALTPNDLKLLYLRYGDNLDSPKVSEKWDANIYGNAFYNKLIVKMKRMLEDDDIMTMIRRKTING